MKKLLNFLLVGGALLGSSALTAANTDTVTVTINITAEDDIFFSGDPAVFNVNPGNSPLIDATTTYTVITNQAGRSITASLAPALPAGVTLAVQLQAPPGGTSAGFVNLTATPATLVTGISNVNASGLTASYRVSATASAAITVTPIVETITYTLTGP